MTALTGETGAGKPLVVTAVDLHGQSAHQALLGHAEELLAVARRGSG
jgi:DNA repair ATPase RecN